jgi:excinuclease ABC subunit B
VDFSEYLELDSLNSVIELMQKEMKKAASNLEFERAAELRDRIWELKNPSQSTVE